MARCLQREPATFMDSLGDAEYTLSYSLWQDRDANGVLRENELCPVSIPQ